jgi:hypothetical protein
VASKKQGTSVSASSHIDFVSVAGTVRVPQDFISELRFTLIDFIMHYEFVRADEGNRTVRVSVSFNFYFLIKESAFFFRVELIVLFDWTFLGECFIL